ncbi:hypothetical protein Tco_0710628, partial [Tanacetum coccineum]
FTSILHRSPVDSVPSSTPVMGSLAPTGIDLLPPRKRFRDSYSSEASIEEDTEIDPIETEVDIELGIGDGDDVRDHVEIDPRDVRDDTEEYEADTSAGDTVRDGIVRSFEDMPIDLDDAVRDFYHHMSEVRIDRIVGIETAQRRLEADQLIARGQRVSMIERIDSLRLENLKVRAMLDIKRDRVNSLRLHMSLSQEEFRQVRRDRDDTRERLRRLESVKSVNHEAITSLLSSTNHVSNGESTRGVGFCAKLTHKTSTNVTSKNDMLAILRCPQFDQTATIEAQMIEEMIG